jgi:hypothetical protein
VAASLLPASSRRPIIALDVKENRFGWPLRGIVWFAVAIVGSCAVIALLARYVHNARSLEKVFHRVEAVTARDLFPLGG